MRLNVHKMWTPLRNFGPRKWPFVAPPGELLINDFYIVSRE